MERTNAYSLLDFLTTAHATSLPLQQSNAILTTTDSKS